ncbi:acyltransferase [Neorhizobium sp. P12A]|uniref:acyltransferase n=1 Tax=Neorhizobium sp. P12A TaxID=2268027 RepID=UPI0011EDDE9A|nr:acyltransferase [Neorhizobium sp. P12A]KAA0700382.1 acyltransferase [Neorhizobium sp. P12A]
MRALFRRLTSPKGLTLGRKTTAILDGKITGPGHLWFGIQWGTALPLQSNILIRKASEVSVKGDFQIYSGSIFGVGEGARIKLGSGYINNEARISIAGELTIGDDVVIGPQLYMLDQNHHRITGSKPRPKKIVIGNHVWIAARVTILPGVTIGDGCVIGAGSVVTKDIPPGTLWAGNPARYIRDVEWD